MRIIRKKVLAVLLSMVMAFGLFTAVPITASAATATIGLSTLWGMDIFSGAGEAPWSFYYSTRTLELRGAGDTYYISGTNSELSVQVTTTATGAVINSQDTNVTATVQPYALLVQADCRLNTGGPNGSRFTKSGNSPAISISTGCTLTIGSMDYGSYTLTATSGDSFGIRINGNLVLADTVHVTAIGYNAIASSSPIVMSDGAKLTMTNNSASADETHTFQKSNTASTHLWKLTGSAVTSDSFDGDTITVTIPAGTTGSIERTIPRNVSFTAVQTGGTSGTADSTGINLTFSDLVEHLTADDITITNGTGVVTKGTLSGSGTTWTIGLASVTSQGNVTVTVGNFGWFNVITGAQTVAVYKNTLSPPTITSANNFSCVTGTGGNFSLTATGTAPITFGLSGTVPAGVSISGSSLVVAATVAPNTYNFTVTASNGVSPDATQAFTLTVTAIPPTPPTITSVNNFSCITGTGGSFPLTATGTTPITFGLSGTVPAGVTVSGSTLNVAASVGVGTYNFTVTATNGTSPDATQAFTLTVTAAAVAPTITSASSASFVTGTGGSFPLTATGTAPVTFSLGGTVPAGVSISGNTLVVAGSVPAGVYNLEILASNAAQSDASQQFALTVTAANTLPATGDGTLVLLLLVLLEIALGAGFVFAYRHRARQVM